MWSAILKHSAAHHALSMADNCLISVPLQAVDVSDLSQIAFPSHPKLAVIMSIAMHCLYDGLCRLSAAHALQLCCLMVQELCRLGSCVKDSASAQLKGHAGPPLQWKVRFQI